MKFKLRKIGFTLTEVLIVVVIMGLLATLALPMFVKTLEKAKVGEAVSNLNLIRTGQKIYFLERGYFSGGNTGIAALNVEDPNDTANRYFYYEVTSNPGELSDFIAQATRGGGDAIKASEPYQDDHYTIQKDGTVHGRFTTGEEL